MKAIRIFFLSFKISVLNELAHKVNFTMRFLSDSIFFIVYFVFYTVIYSYVSNINGWGKYDMLFLMGTFHIIISLFTSFFVPNLAQIPWLVKSGEIDTFLLKPINSRYILSIHTIDIGSLVNIALGISIVIVSSIRLEIDVGFKDILLYVLYTILGVTIIYNLLFILISTIFWLGDSTWSISFIMMFNSFADKPVSIYKGIIYRILIYFFPIALVANVPANVFLNKNELYLNFVFVLISIILFYVAKNIWDKGIESYEGASV